MSEDNSETKHNSEDYIKGRQTIDILTKLLHPIDSKLMDSSCAYIEWIGCDLNQCPGVGDWKCSLRQFKNPGEYGGYDIDYLECNCNNHNNCSFYLQTKENK